ncbi:MAG: hypothetical protein OXC56_03110, partial [Chloroflexi bacterium]|nr:hypothetical protein [Chloroflexota bacterium]
KIMGFSSMVMMAGMIIGPVVAGISYDVTGSYRIGFVILAILALSGGAFFAFAKKPELPESAPVPMPTPMPVAPQAQFAVATNGAGTNGAHGNGAHGNGVTHAGMAETVEWREGAWPAPASANGGNGAGAPGVAQDPTVPAQQR